MSRRSRFSIPELRVGCSYILGVGLVILVLLAINGLLVRAFLQANDQLASDVRLAQSLYFVLPIFLIFVEFWLYDLIRQNRRR